MVTVAIAGKFDSPSRNSLPLHEGHVDHIVKASKLGDRLVVITHNDGIVARHSRKGFCYKPLARRIEDIYYVLRHFGIPGVVVVGADTDGTVTRTLGLLEPSIFAKGGDRTPNNMPKKEIDICRRINCKIVYGIGDLLNSSSALVGGLKNDQK